MARYILLLNILYRIIYICNSYRFSVYKLKMPFCLGLQAYKRVDI